MEALLEILKYTLPVIIIIGGVYLIIRRFFQHEILRSKNERMQIIRHDVFSVRMQAYERIVLLLERISPNQLILRLNKQGMTTGQLQPLLIQTIRDEFDHNLSQQVYISSKAWDLTKSAREEMIRLINTAAVDIDNDEPSTVLAAKILELFTGLEIDPVIRAIEFVKQEARGLF
ncbi:MAG: hypothetical protein GX128_01090 [Bacteroidales bacterium]|jgi:hypothetical protein|nr:hypothetical protein [Bacteroidales bacterium]